MTCPNPTSVEETPWLFQFYKSGLGYARKKKMNHLYDVILMFHYYQPKKNFNTFDIFFNTSIVILDELLLIK